MKRLKIKVTQEDINDGEVLDACNCPIARATRRGLSEAGHQVSKVTVNNTHVKVRAKTGHITNYKLSPAAKRFVNAFDNCNDVNPSVFVVTAEVG